MKIFLELRSFKLLFLVAIEYIKRNRLGLILAGLTISLLTAAQVKFTYFYDSSSISLGFIGTYQEHDLPPQVTKLLSQGLVISDSNGRMKGNLVTGWEINNDATNFRFKLKDGLKWADNSEIKSKDLVFDIPNVEIETSDDKIIQFNLKESYSALPSLLTKPILKKGTLMGTGPYKITRIEKSRIFITKIELNPLDPKLPKVFIRFYPQEKVALTGFNLGEVQALLGFSDIRAVMGNPKVFLKQTTDYSKIVAVLFQTKDSLLSSRSLRQALAFAAPKIEGVELADSPYQHSSWAYNPDSKKYLDNPKEAQVALERAKSALSEEKLASELILTAPPNLEEAALKIVKEWRRLGLDAKLRIESGIAQNFQSLLITQSIPQDPDQYILWHATQEKTNLSKYDSKRVDKDLEDGRKIIIEEERKMKYFDFQKTLLEDTPAIFLYFPKYNIAYLKKKEALLNKVLDI